MHKTLYFFFFLFLLSLPDVGLAQTFFGVKGQINNMSAPLVVKRDLFSKSQGSTLNPGFGIFFEKALKGQWAIQPEINYQEQQSTFILTGSEKIYNLSILKYIRMPVLLKYSIPLENCNLMGLFGPNPGYAISLKSGEIDHSLKLTNYKRLDFTEHQVSKFDIGFLAGIGIEKIIANKFKTKLSLRYNFGLIDIMKDNESTFRNSAYILDMGVMIPLSQ